MQVQRQPIDHRDQEVQGDRGRRGGEEDYGAIGEDPKDGQAWQYRGAEVGLPEEGHRLFGLLVCPE